MRVPYQFNLALTSNGIRGRPGARDNLGQLGVTLTVSNPLLPCDSSDDFPDVEFLDESHGVHLLSEVLYHNSFKKSVEIVLDNL